MLKIVIKKEKKIHIFVVVDKHKIKDVIGSLKNEKLTIDFFKLKRYISLGCLFSTTAFNVIYKNVIKTI